MSKKQLQLPENYVVSCHTAKEAKEVYLKYYGTKKIFMIIDFVICSPKIKAIYRQKKNLVMADYIRKEFANFHVFSFKQWKRLQQKMEDEKTTFIPSLDGTMKGFKLRNNGWIPSPDNWKIDILKAIQNMAGVRSVIRKDTNHLIVNLATKEQDKFKCMEGEIYVAEKADMYCFAIFRYKFSCVSEHGFFPSDKNVYTDRVVRDATVMEKKKLMMAEIEYGLIWNGKELETIK